jgi:EAL domain-containing protein (putative c-di-GMP-specific phosphodiesterase class I)
MALGRWVLETALAQLAIWQQSDELLAMSVNMSARQLDGPQLVNDLACLLETSSVNPRDVTIELTETLPVGAAAALRLDALCALGVHLAADDFGSGVASYAALRRFSFSSIKIDKTLIDGLGEVSRDKAIAQVASIVDMAHASDLSVVAEGIESREVGDLVRELGCDYAQGYYFGVPSEPEQALAMLVGRDITYKA